MEEEKEPDMECVKTSRRPSLASFWWPLQYPVVSAIMQAEIDYLLHLQRMKKDSQKQKSYKPFIEYKSKKSVLESAAAHATQGLSSSIRAFLTHYY